MYCSRLDHFVRLNADGTIGKCGHMVNAPGFESWTAMQDSAWLADVRNKMAQDQWPTECQRCQATERMPQARSIRLDADGRHKILSQIKSDYVILGGVLDNVCNSACQSCQPQRSTKIGSLHSRDYIRIDNSHMLDHVPWDRVVEVDVNGGEPAASPNYQKLLDDLPPMTRVLRINTNCSRVIPNIENILDRGLFVIITMSLDGTHGVHDYVRWPIPWSDYQRTVAVYRQLTNKYKNLQLQAWTVVHALNAADMPNVAYWCQANDIKHSWAWLRDPDALNAGYTNTYTLRARKILESSDQSVLQDMSRFVATYSNNQASLDAFIAGQDSLRNISIGNYL